MPVFLSAGVFVREVDLSILPTPGAGVVPVFVGTCTKGPLNTPTYCTSPADAMDKFGPPTITSYLMYAALGFLEEGGACYIVRVAVTCEDGQEAGLSNICIDDSGSNVNGWGRIPIFSGIDYGRINLREVTADDPLVFHPASVSNLTYNDASVSSTEGATVATLSISGTYTGSLDDAFTVLITGDPDLSAGASIDGATYEVIKNSSGAIVAEGTLRELTRDTSQQISIGDGLRIIVRCPSGVLAVNDTFTFNVTADNRVFQFAIEGVTGSQHTMPTATYTTTAAFVAAFNALLSSEGYTAVAYDDDGTTIPQIKTTVAGRWIQLIGTAGWASEVGQQQYAYDIPRSYLLGSEDGPYSITSQSNKIVMRAIGNAATEDISFAIATGLNITADQLAANIDPNGIIAGNQIFNAISITVPDGTKHVLLVTTVDYELYQLQMLASFTNAKTLRFAETVGISYPYKRGYRGFTDSRVSLPAGSSSDESIPLSCESSPGSTQCAADTAYYADIVGWLVATSPGTWLTGYKVNLETYTEGIGEIAGRYKIVISDAQGLVVDQILDVSFDKTATRYIANIINPGTSIGGTNGNAYVNWEARPSYLNNDPTDPATYVVRQPSTFSGREFAGMADGVPTDAALSSYLDAAVIGSSVRSTGIFSVQNKEKYTSVLLATPGFTSGSVIAQALQLCETRGDMLYLVDSPFGLRDQQVVDWHNGMLLSDLASTINSSYGALYWPWIKIFDQSNVEEVWIPPSGHVAAIFARSARTNEPWTPPAGRRRGQILTALEVEFSPGLESRNLLQGGSNAVNPIVDFTKSGVTVYGQKTLLRSNSVLNRVSTRMLLIEIKRGVLDLLEDVVFEPNDEVLYSQVTNILEPYMADIQGRRGVTGYKVVCDTTNNTPTTRDRQELHVAIFVKPTPTAEYVAVDLVLLRTGASFSSREVLAAAGIVGS